MDKKRRNSLPVTGYEKALVEEAKDKITISSLKSKLNKLSKITEKFKSGSVNYINKILKSIKNKEIRDENTNKECKRIVSVCRNIKTNLELCKQDFESVEKLSKKIKIGSKLAEYRKLKKGLDERLDESMTFLDKNLVIAKDAHIILDKLNMEELERYKKNFEKWYENAGDDELKKCNSPLSKIILKKNPQLLLKNVYACKSLDDLKLLIVKKWGVAEKVFNGFKN